MKKGNLQSYLNRGSCTCSASRRDEEKSAQNGKGHAPFAYAPMRITAAQGRYRTRTIRYSQNVLKT